MVIGHVRKSNKGEIKMKNYFNKIIIMFVMALGIIGFNYTSAFAEETNQSIKINNTTLTFDKIIYVDGVNGDDSSGDGNINSPFKTIKKGMDLLSNDSKYRKNGAIVLKKGSYDITDCVKGYSNNLNQSYNGMVVSWICNKGDEGKVFISSDNGFEVMQIENNPTYRIKMSFYGLVFKQIKNDYFHLGGDDWTNEYYNCVFDNVGLGGYNGIVSNTNIIVENCIFNNCYISFSGYEISGKCINTLTTNKLIQPQNGEITSVIYNGQIDNNYNIISDGWENTGIGTNPDNTKANIGVYGGEFAWSDWNKGCQSIYLDKSTLNLKETTSSKLIATTTPSGAEVTWKSSDESVATVDENGKVTGIKEGQATITATIRGTDIKAICEVTVTKEDIPAEPEDPEQEYIINTANAKGNNTNNASGSVSIKFNGTAETTLSVVKTADVKEVWVGDTFTYTIVVTNTGSKTAKAVVINDSAPNHIDFIVDRVTTTKGKINESSTSKNILINVGDIEPSETVTIKIPVNGVA